MLSLMKIRLEGTKEEIRQLENLVNHGLIATGRKVKTISKFYPDRQNSTEILNGVSENTGRIYVEII